MTMRLSAQGAAFIAAHDGIVPKAYRDPVGVLTIGTGFTSASTAFRAWWATHRPGQAFDMRSTITRAEAEYALVMLTDEKYGR